MRDQKNKYYFQFRLDELDPPDNPAPKICVGVCREDFLVNQDLSRQKNVWCLNLASGDKYHKQKWSPYYDTDLFNKKTPPKFDVFKPGSVIGVLLDMDRGLLHFYKDGNDLGVAFNQPELKEGSFYPFVQI